MKKINESFSCLGCKKEIPKASKTCRNHCPWCFLSQHVDGELPGDRDTECHGTMVPSEYEIKNGATKIHFICLKCRKDHRNKSADDDEMGELDTGKNGNRSWGARVRSKSINMDGRRV